MTVKKLALIDGYGFVFRAFHSLPPLTRADGTPVGAVYGFTNMLIKLLASLHVSHVAVVFDAGSKTFRNDIYPAYKANRPPCPEELIPQFSIVREAAESLNLAILEKAGVEADDIIATLARKHAQEGFEVLIVSSDKDLMQLVGENIKMYDAMKNKMIGDAEVLEKFAVAPNKVLDVLSLMGDASDNIPGVKGIGPKTAAELIAQFGSLENIFEHLDEIKQDKRRQLLTEGVEKAKLSKILLSLKEDVEMKITLQDLEVQAIDPHKLISFLQFQGFRSLVERVKKEFGVEGGSGSGADFLANQNSTTKYSKITPSKDSQGSTAFSADLFSAQNAAENNSSNSAATSSGALISSNIVAENSAVIADSNFDEIKKITINSAADFAQLYKKSSENGVITIDFEANAEAFSSLTFSTCKNDELIKEIYYFEPEIIAAEKEMPMLDLFSFANDADEKPSQSKPEQKEIFAEIEKILLNQSVKKIFFDSKNFFKLFAKACSSNIKAISSFEDVSLINHLINSSIKNDFRELVKMNLAEDLEVRGFTAIFDELDKSKTPEVFSNQEKKIEFYAFKNYALWQLYKILAPKIISEKLTSCYQIYEKPLLPVLAAMEHVGVKIDTQKLHQLSQEFAKKILQLTVEIYKIAGQEFNIASPKQLGEILFEKMAIDSKKKSKKTGVLSTNSEVLEELEEQGFEIATKILEFRKLSKLKNTYADALPKEINAKTGRIHTHLSSITTTTGRLSSSNPNLQNIPIKSVEGQKIRQCFIAEKGHLLVSADYSQIELRVIAHIAKIDTLITAFKENKDIHRITAAQVFGLKEEDVTPEIRSKAKAINFGIIYGISGFGLARQLKIGRKEAGDYIKSYLETYPGIDVYMKKYIELARENGFVETLGGRKCFIRSINDKNHAMRSEAERLAINAPIQGSAADIIKKAMIKLEKKLRENNLAARMILQIHDELIIEAPENEVEIVSQLIKSEMESAMTLSVPLRVDVEVGNCWN